MTTPLSRSAPRARALAGCHSGSSRMAWSKKPRCSRRSMPRASARPARHAAGGAAARPTPATSPSRPPRVRRAAASTSTPSTSTSTRSGWSATSCSPSTACCRCSSAASGCSSAVADPTNLHAIDEIKFQTGLAIEAIVVEDDKLQQRVDKALEQVDTSMPALGDEDDFDLEILEVTGGDEDRRRRRSAATTSKTRRSCASSTR